MPVYAQSSTLRSLLIPLVDIDQTTVANEDVLQYNSTTGKFENQTLTSLGLTLITGASNSGTGEGIFKDLTTGILNFKSFIAGSGITITDNGNDLTLDVAAAAATGANIGTGTGIFSAKVGNDIQLRSLKAHDDSINLVVSLSTDTNEIEFKNTAEINTASNLGSGNGVFASKAGADLQFKTIVAGTNVSITSNANEITISSAVTTETATSFQFDAAFDGNGNLQSVSNLPAGWSSSITGNKVTVTHTAAKMVKNISYWGKDAYLGWQLRFPNAGFQATIPVGNETTQFILDINASVAGADASSTAKVNVIF